jgi:predicted Ser/Thr protein kinase
MGERVAKSVGRYDVLEELGRGGMAVVYLARQVDLDRLVALKELSALRQSDPAFTERFLRESRLAGSLSHPNIVTVHDYFEYEGTPYIAMEYVSGGSLRPHIGHMSLTQVAGALEGILSALDHAEHHQVVHRDLKPENVMVTAQGKVKITDFGIAKATGKATTAGFVTAAGTTVGTPNYMAPEQAMGQAVGPATDLYSLGVMAFELFVGHVPFYDTDEPMAVLMRQVSDPIPPARSLNHEIDPSISDWIERLLVKDPKKRTSAAADAWDEFEEIVIRLVGPRWRRSAALVGGAERPVDAPPAPHTPPPTEAARPPLMPTWQIPNWGPGESEAPTRPLDEHEDRAVAPTVMPDLPTKRLDDPGADRSGAERSGTKRRVLQVALVATLTLAVLAAAFGRPGSRQPAGAGSASEAQQVSLARTVTGPAMSVRVPRGWRRAGSPPELGLPLARPAAAAPRGRGAGPLVEFGVVKGGAAANNALLPAPLLDAVGRTADSPPARKAVRLSGQSLQAWRYAGLRPVGSNRALTVYAVPTSAGVATVVCAVPPSLAASLAPQCDAIAGSLRLRSSTPYPIGASTSYASALNSTIGNLDQTSKAQEEGLQAAQTLAGQAAAAQALARSYSAAARALVALQLSPADGAANATLVGALRRTAAAYRTAARAARAGNADGYRTASAGIPAATAAVNSALAAIRGGGYTPAGQSGASRGSAGGSQSGGGAGSQSGGDGESDSGAGSDVGDSRSDDPSDDSADP